MQQQHTSIFPPTSRFQPSNRREIERESHKLIFPRSIARVLAQAHKYNNTVACVTRDTRNSNSNPVRPLETSKRKKGKKRTTTSISIKSTSRSAKRSLSSSASSSLCTKHEACWVRCCISSSPHTTHQHASQTASRRPVRSASHIPCRVFCSPQTAAAPSAPHHHHIRSLGGGGGEGGIRRVVVPIYYTPFVGFYFSLCCAVLAVLCCAAHVPFVVLHL